MAEPKKINALYCYVIDEEDGGEGIPAVQAPDGGWMPCVAGDVTHLESLKPIAQAFANKLQRPLRLLKFTHKEIIDEVQPSLVMKPKPS